MPITEYTKAILDNDHHDTILGPDDEIASVE